MKKHAYLIMAHNEFELLKRLIIQLDDTRNDIYIHIDKKVNKEIFAKLKEETKKLIRYSQLYFIPRTKITWGGDSQIKCEINLLKESSKNHYDFYHLLSGVDFPIKSQKYIHDFFDKNSKLNFIDIDSINSIENYKIQRIKEYHFFQNKIGRRSDKRVIFYYRLDKISKILQKLFHIERYRNVHFDIRKGTNWFSINHLMVKEILKNEKLIKKYFYYSVCADEMFLQTIAYNSKLKDTIVDDCLRLIDWKRGGPYTFDINDFEMIRDSEKLFVRKLSMEKSEDLISKIENELL